MRPNREQIGPIGPADGWEPERKHFKQGHVWAKNGYGRPVGNG